MLDPNVFTSELAKRLKGLKKDLGAFYVRQGYKGTGARSHRRQIWVSLPNAERPIDLWLKDDSVLLGGVCFTNFSKILIKGKSVDEVYTEIAEKLRDLQTSL